MTLETVKASAVLSYLTSRQWAMDPDALRAIADEVAAGLEGASPADLQAQKDDSAEQPSGPGYVVRNGVAHIKIQGPILKEVPCIMRFLGIRATSTLEVEKALDEALYDESVERISLDIDSPGGSLDGTQDLADAVFAARGLKPISAHASGLMASAAYWIGSQADWVSSSGTTQVGSIGVFRVFEDTSEAAAKRGVRVQVISNHELKGAGVPGTQLTEAQRKDAQRMVDEATGIFCAAVARGRGLDLAGVRAMATGQVWFGDQAKDRGLIDAVMSTAEERNVDKDKQIAAQAEQIATLTAQVKSLEADSKAATEKAAASSAKVTELEGTVKTLRAEQRDMLMARYADRVAPADVQAVKDYGEFCAGDLAKFEAHLKSRPVVVQRERVSSPGAAPAADQQPELSATMLAVAKQMGNSPEDIRKHGGLAQA